MSDRTSQHLLLGMTALLLTAPLCWAQIPSQHNRIKPVPREPQYPDTTRVPEEPRQNIVLPTEPPEFGTQATDRSEGVIAHVPTETRHLPEGYVLSHRTAHIRFEKNWFIATIDPIPGLPDPPPVRILPNGQLTRLESVLAEAPAQTEFDISGRMTEFNGVDYVLIEDVREGTAIRRQPMTLREGKDQAGIAADRHPASSTQSVTTQPASTTPSREPTAEEVVRQLMQNRPVRALVIPTQPATDATTRPAKSTGAPSENARDTTRWSEETTLVDQPGRLVAGEGWWTFAFEDLGHAAQQKPLRILPSQLLETAIGLTGGGAKGVVLVISGDINVYKGMEYLMLRKVLVRRDLGNFR